MVQCLLWAVYEFTFESARSYGAPLWDVRVSVRFTAPSGEEHPVEAFWDGGGAWRVRFCPDEAGEWSWRSECSDAANAGLHGRTGQFLCTSAEGDNPLLAHGPPRVSDDRRHFVHADGTPFFWLADTAWNGAILARPEDWQAYLGKRREQGFTAVQFVSTQWRGGSRDRQGETAFSVEDGLRVNPAWFQRLDAKVAALNEHGLVAAPVVMWAIGEDDPGRLLSEPDAVRLARYVVARWGAYQVVWLLGGDGDYRGDAAERWRRIGRAVFGDRPDRLVTMHPMGQSWVADEFRDEPWFAFIGYQSGHGSSTEHLRWLVAGPPAQQWLKEPVRPVVNLEPNYEAHPPYHTHERFTDREVRRAAYWSLLIAPPAGLTYGHNHIWPWRDEPGPPEGHDYIGQVGAWRDAVESPGAGSIRVLRDFFESLPWWRLRPAPDLLMEQPGRDDPSRFVAAAASEDDALAVIYLPEGGKLSLRTGRLRTPAASRWFDPRTGGWRDGPELTGGDAHVEAPDENDWIIVIQANADRDQGGDK